MGNFNLAARTYAWAVALDRYLNENGPEPADFPGVIEGEIANGAVTSDAIAAGAVVASKLTESSQGWSTDLVFSASDHNTVAWTSGTIKFTGGSSASIASGNTGNMAALTYIYYDPTVSTTVLQVTTDWDDLDSEKRILVCIANNTADTGQRAFFLPAIGTFGINETVIGPNSIATGAIQANAITAAQINAGAVTAGKISVAQLSAIAADLGSITAGTVTGALLRTAASGARIELDSTNGLRCYDSSGLVTQIHVGHTFNGVIETDSIIGRGGEIAIDHAFVANPTRVLLQNNVISLILGAAGEGAALFTTNNLELRDLNVEVDGDLNVTGKITMDGNDIIDSSRRFVGAGIILTGSNEIRLATGGLTFSSDTGVFGTSSSVDIYADSEEIFAVTNPGTSTTLSGCFIMYNNALKQIRFKDDGSGDRVMYIQP